jgi:hypothetical protein
VRGRRITVSGKRSALLWMSWPKGGKTVAPTYVEGLSYSVPNEDQSNRQEQRSHYRLNCGTE